MTRLHVRTLLVVAPLCAVACVAGCMGNLIPRAPQHGPKIVLQVDPKPGDAWPKSGAGRTAALETMASILERRAASLRVTDAPTVTIEGMNKLVVELPGLQTPRTAALVLAQVGRLEFYHVKDVSSPQNPLGKWRMEVGSSGEKDYVFTGPKGETLSSAIPAEMRRIMTDVIGTPTEKPVLTGADLLPNAKSALSYSKQPVIEIEFNQHGTQTFRHFTGSHVNEILAIVYNGKLLTAPTIKDKISNGKAEISGFKTLKEAKEIAGCVNSGALPVHLRVVDIRK